VKAPGQLPAFDQRWNVWGSAFGGGNQTDGDPVIGSHDLTATAAGVAAGADYRVTPDTKLGFALAGGSTNWTLSQGAGGGHGDSFMAGIYGKTNYGPVYLTGSLAAADHWMSTDRMAFGGDHLTADFDAQSYGGRIEGGYRFATMFGGMSPYAAAQFQSFRTPAYAETDQTGGGFGLAYASRNATDTRSELGGRFDRELIPLSSDEVVTLTGRLAWAHDWVSDPTLAASFQALPGQSFLVNGATPAKDSALASAGAEVRFASGWSIAAKFDGEFADHSTTYAGTGVLRYRW
jgi:outer membrane autotransporter protein